MMVFTTSAMTHKNPSAYLVRPVLVDSLNVSQPAVKALIPLLGKLDSCDPLQQTEAILCGKLPYVHI